jgi:hypothetical protein
MHVSRTSNHGMCGGVSETATSLAVWRCHKKRFCRLIWLDFVCEHASSYIFLWHENVSGFIRDTIFLQRCAHAPSSCVIRKVVIRMLRRITLVYVIWRKIWTKRQVNIWTSVCTQDMQRYRRTKAPFRARRTTSATEVFRSPPHIAGLGVRATWMYAPIPPQTVQRLSKIPTFRFEWKKHLWIAPEQRYPSMYFLEFIMNR